MWFTCFPVWSGLLVWPVQLAVTTNVMRIGQDENGLKIFFFFFFLWALIPGKHENYQVHPMYLSMMMMATIMIFFWFFFVKKIWLIDWLVSWLVDVYSSHTLVLQYKVFRQNFVLKKLDFFPEKKLKSNSNVRKEMKWMNEKNIIVCLSLTRKTIFLSFFASIKTTDRLVDRSIGFSFLKKLLQQQPLTFCLCCCCYLSNFTWNNNDNNFIFGKRKMMNNNRIFLKMSPILQCNRKLMISNNMMVTQQQSYDISFHLWP